MSERTPRVTIGMPVYNAARYLADAIDALLAQTFRDFELLISDNGSTDRTPDICRSYADRDPRVRYHRQEQNRGAIWNFNHVFSLARTPYFKWSSFDDICQPTFLQQCVNVLDSHPDVVWCHTQSGKIDEQGQHLSKDPDAHDGFPGWVHTSQAGLPRQYHDSQHVSRRFRGVLLGTDWCADSYGVIRTDTLRKTCLLPCCYGAEKVLMADLSLHGLYHEVPETLFYQRVHGEASGNLKSAAAQQSFMSPKTSTRFAFTRIKLLGGYMKAIRNAELRWPDRWRCYAALVSYVCQFRKWGRILRAALSGAGVKRHQAGGAWWHQPGKPHQHSTAETSPTDQTIAAAGNSHQQVKP